MTTEHLLDNKDDFEGIDELEDPEVPEMGEEEVLAPENSRETGFDDTESEGPPEPVRGE
ncbi:MAG: hypothetical protein AAB789_01105 [Patescibacteria group bacterium]